MSEIVNKIPAEIWLDIFDLLSYDDKKRLSLVCKHWYRLAISRFFLQNTLLKLEHVLINPKCPPWSVLMAEDAVITFDQVIIGDGVVDVGDTDKFWAYVGSHCLTLIFQDVRINCKNRSSLLKHFTVLERLELPHVNQLFELQIPDTVKHVYISEGVCYKSTVEKQTKLKQLQLESLTTERFFMLDIEEFSHHVPLFNVSRHLHHFVRSFQLSVIQICPTLNLLKMNKLNFEHVTGLNNRTISLRFLAKFREFTNLESLALKITPQTGCFFTHSHFLPNSLKNITLFGSHEVAEGLNICEICSNFMMESCQNIHKLELRGYIPKVEEFLNRIPKSLQILDINIEKNVQRINIKFPNLKALYLNFASECHVDCKNWPPMPKLHDIKLGKNAKLNMYNLKILTKLSPNVRYLKIAGYTSVSKLEEFESGWPSLRSLDTEFYGPALSVVDSLRKKWQNLCQFGSLVPLPCHGRRERLTHEYQSRMFEMYPTLRQCFKISYALYCSETYQTLKMSEAKNRSNVPKMILMPE